MTWRGVVTAVNHELYPRMATAIGLSVDELIENELIGLTAFDEETVDAVIRVLKIKKPALLNKEIEFIKGIVERTVQYNEEMKKQRESVVHNSDFKMSQILDLRPDAFFRYKEFNDISDLDPDSNHIPDPKWKGLTANLVMDIYGIFEAM